MAQLGTSGPEYGPLLWKLGSRRLQMSLVPDHLERWSRLDRISLTTYSLAVASFNQRRLWPRRDSPAKVRSPYLGDRASPPSRGAIPFREPGIRF